MITPQFATSTTMKFTWDGIDSESGINRVQAALGSDYYQADVTGGWVEITGSPCNLSHDASGNKLELITGQRYYLTLRLTNSAGLATEMASPSILIDNTPPPVPLVFDQGDYINTMQSLRAHWIWSQVDPESGVTYKWALVQSFEEISAAVWLDGDAAMRIELVDFNQMHGHTYYFAVKALNGAGLTSIGMSNGIMVDATAPYIPEVRLINAINLGDPNAQEINYITNNQNLGLWITSFDPESPIDGYLYAWGRPETVDEQERKESAVEQIELDNPQINDGEIIIFIGECTNEAVLVSATGYSTGVILDTGAPRIIDVRGAVSGEQLLFDWNVICSASPVAGYEIALVPENIMDLTPDSWTDVGLARSIVLDGHSLADDHYRLLIRGYNAAGIYSRREGEIDEWGISPRVTLDRIPPLITELVCPPYTSTELAVRVTAIDNLSGINAYQYALGSKGNPFEFSKGWVDIYNKDGLAVFNVSTADIPHNTEVYLMVRVKDNVGVWSIPTISQKVLIDQTIHLYYKYPPTLY